MTLSSSFKEGIKAGIPIGLAYYAVSFTFGMAAVKGGLTVFEATMISVLNLTSAGQFAGIEVMFGAGSLIEMAMTQFIINLRYSLMSFTISQKLEKSLPFYHRFIVAFGVTDEIFGVTAARRGKVHPSFNYGAMLMAIPGWTLGTLSGAVSGSVLPPVLTSALGVAIYAMFIGIIVPPAKHDRKLLYVIFAAMAVSFIFHNAPYLSKISEGTAILIVTVLVASVAAVIMPISGSDTGEGGA